MGTKRTTPVGPTYGGQKTSVPGSVHPLQQKQRVQMCPQCAQTFDTAAQLAQHSRHVHGRLLETADVASAEGN